MEDIPLEDSTRLSYWLNWNFLICLLSVFTSVIVATILIWKYEGSSNVERAHSGEEWLPCWKGLNPVWLMVYRIISFFLILAAAIADVATHGISLFYYYTQWTLILATAYFLFGSVLSICGYFWKEKIINAPKMDVESEQGIYVPLTYKDRESEVSQRQQGEYYFFKIAPFWGHLFQILYQMTAGASLLTDAVYWTVIFPFVTISDYEMGFLTVVVHSLNLVLLVGDGVLNRLQFPWYRISYFILFTAIYVIFEWIVHAIVSTWWPYPFLNISQPNAAIWYWLVAILHLPCYAIFVLFVRLKHLIMARWFPESYDRLR